MEVAPSTRMPDFKIQQRFRQPFLIRQQRMLVTRVGTADEASSRYHAPSIIERVEMLWKFTVQDLIACRLVVRIFHCWMGESNQMNIDSSAMTVLYHHFLAKELNPSDDNVGLIDPPFGLSDLVQHISIRSASERQANESQRETGIIRLDSMASSSRENGLPLSQTLH